MTFVSNQISTGTVQFSETRVENAPARSDTKEFSTVKEAAEINNTSSIYYSGINATTDLEYVLNGNSVKENIIVKSKGGNYKYTFDLSLGGLVAVLNENNTVSLIDPKTAEVQYRIPVPYMYDANGARSYDVTYTLQALEAGEYRLVISADADWINAEGRAFPVVVDPVIEEVAGQDTYIDSLAPSYNFGYNDDMIVGSTQIAFIQGEMPELPNGADVTHAYLTVSYYYDYGVDSGSTTLGAYQVLQPWDEMTLKWNTANAYTNLGISSTLLYSQTLYGSTGATNDEPDWIGFDITDAVASWYDGTASNYGIALRYLSGANDSVYLHTYDAYPEYSAYYTVVYSYNIPDGVYALKNVGNSGLWMDTQNDSSEAGKHIQQYAYSTAPTASFSRGGLFKISRVPNTELYVIRLMTNNLLTFGISGNEILTVEIPEDDADVDAAKLFHIEYQDNGFVLRPHNSTYVITANQTTASGAAGAPNSYLTKVLQTNATSSAKWTLHQYTGVQKSGGTLNFPLSWIDVGIITHNTYYADAVVYSTEINANTPYIMIDSSDEDIVYSMWDWENKVLTINAQIPGTIKLNLRVNSPDYSVIEQVGQYNFNILPEEGAYYIKNAGTGRYIDVEGPSESSGAVIQEWGFHTGAQEKWIVEHVDNCYIRLRSAYSGLYMGVDSSNPSLVRQYSVENDYTLWKFDDTASGHVKLICKALESSSNVLGVSSSVSYNGLDLTQTTYSEDATLTDEWYLYLFKDASFVAIPLSDWTDSGNPFTGPIESIQGIGYSDCYDNYSNISNSMIKKEFVERMQFSRITVIRTHGLPNLIMLKGDMLNRSDLLAMPADTLQCSELIVYVACETAQGGKYAENLVAATIDAGARTVIGFENSVATGAATRWISKFFEYYADYSMVDSKNIDDVLTDTDDYMQDDPQYEFTVNGELITLRTFVIAGESEFPN